MEAATATLMQSPFGVFRVSNSISRSLNLTSNGSAFVNFGAHFGLSIKVLHFITFLIFC